MARGNLQVPQEDQESPCDGREALCGWGEKRGIFDVDSLMRVVAEADGIEIEASWHGRGERIASSRCTGLRIPGTFEWPAQAGPGRLAPVAAAPNVPMQAGWVLAWEGVIPLLVPEEMTCVLWGRVEGAVATPVVGCVGQVIRVDARHDEAVFDFKGRCWLQRERLSIVRAAPDPLDEGPVVGVGDGDRVNDVVIGRFEVTTEHATNGPSAVRLETARSVNVVAVVGVQGNEVPVVPDQPAVDPILDDPISRRRIRTVHGGGRWLGRRRRG